MQRFFNKVNKTDTCWLWTASKRSSYGAFKYEGKIRLAHRVSWELHNGKIPDGMLVCHRCDVRICVNPAHLFLGTQQQNMEDAYSKGRMIIPVGFQFKKGDAHPYKKLTLLQKNEIRSRYIPRLVTLKMLSIEYGVDKSLIGKIIKNSR